VDPDDTLEFTKEADKPRAKEALAHGVMALAELQDKLYAQDKWAVLLIFQAMTPPARTARSSTSCQASIRKVARCIPSNLPRARIWTTIISGDARNVCRTRDTSEFLIAVIMQEVLVVRVHPEFLAKQTLPPKLMGKKIWEERFEDIRNFEQYLTRNGVIVRKFFLHVSKKEQKQRFLDRIEDPLKNWKFSSNDANERDFWDDYMEAYEDSGKRNQEAPWYVVPADNN
jgi:Polyphosphate kinase 2 (PPK2)